MPRFYRDTKKATAKAKAKATASDADPMATQGLQDCFPEQTQRCQINLLLLKVPHALGETTEGFQDGPN